MLVIALNTGMRKGEILGLCWDRIDFEQKMITVSRTYSRHGLQENTKTKLIRRVPMNPELETILKYLQRNQRCPKFVFTEKDGSPIRPDHFSDRQFKNALKLAGVRTVRFHDLRHTYASQFVMNGGDMYALSSILGHTDIEMTKRYAHLSSEYLRKASHTVGFSADSDNGDSSQIAPEESLRSELHLVSRV